VCYRSVVSGFIMNVTLDVNTLSQYRAFVEAVSQEKQWKLAGHNSNLLLCSCFHSNRNVNTVSGWLRPTEDTRLTYVPPGLKLKNSTWCSLCVECFIRISEQTAIFTLYSYVIN
jgi:hypothetical protein